MSIDTLDPIKQAEVGYYNLPSAAPPTIATVRNLLEQAGLNRERAFDVSESTAFTRAIADIRDKEIRPTAFKGDDKAAYVRIDRVNTDETGKDITREKLGVYALVGSVVGPINGSCLTTLDKLRASYHAALVSYTWADVGKVIKDILDKDGAGAYSPKKNGGVYFFPVTGRDLLGKLEVFCRSLGGSFFRIMVPTGETHREEVSGAIYDSMMADLDVHQIAIDSYVVDTKIGVMENRRTFVEQTTQQIERLTALLNADSKKVLLDRISQLDHLLTSKQTAAQVALEAQPRGRRIVMTQMPAAAEVTQPELALRQTA